MKYDVRGNELLLIEDEEILSNSVERYTAEFTFDSSWGGWTTRAVFRNYKSQEAREMILDENGSCMIPWEVLQCDGYLIVGVYGIKGDVTRPILYANRKYIKQGTEPADPGQEPSPDIFSQIVNRIEKSVIKSAEINSYGHLVITTQNGEIYDAGVVSGAGGETAAAGGLAVVEVTGDGTAYMATVPGFELEHGVAIVIVPDTTNILPNPTLNIDGTGAVEIRTRSADSTSSVVSLRAGQIAAGKPLVCIFDGMYWIAQGLEDADEEDFPEISNLEIEQIIANIGGL